MKKLMMVSLASSITLLLTACVEGTPEGNPGAEYKYLSCKKFGDLTPNEAKRATELMHEKRDRDQKIMADMNQEQLKQFMLKDKEDMKCK